jgi:hypothetical protein
VSEVDKILFRIADQARGEDWYDRRQREKREAREKEQREREAREAKHQRVSNTWEAWYAALDQRTKTNIERYLFETYSTAVAQFTSEYFTKRSAELRRKDKELEARIAELKRRVELLSQGKREKFEFARGRGDVFRVRGTWSRR